MAAEKETIPSTYDVEEVRRLEFPRLSGTCYLDCAGAPLYANSLVNEHCRTLCAGVFGNPHSANASGEHSLSMMDEARHRLLQELGTSNDTYSVVFTAGCTAALQLLADSFPWSAADGERCNQECGRSVFALLDDNHTSVVGMRGVAWQQGASSVVFSAEGMETCAGMSDLLDCSRTVHRTTATSQTQDSGDQRQAVHDDVTAAAHANRSSRSASGNGVCVCPCSEVHHLVAYPLQSNFNGVKYPMAWCSRIQDSAMPCRCHCTKAGSHSKCRVRCHSVLDISAAVGTSSLHLGGEHQPHFAVVSLYKWLGYPTGLGALLVHRDAADLLSSSYFGGGTVSAYSPHADFAMLRSSVVERLEHGTASFLSTAAIPCGFNTLFSMVQSMRAVEQHTFNLAQFTFRRLSQMRHFNEQPVVEIHSSTSYESSSVQGPVVTFSVLQPDGAYVGYSQVEKLAVAHNIHLRTGCFCNVGACQKWLKISTERLRHHWSAGHRCGDDMDLVEGHPTGAVRVSFGYMSTFEDANVFLKFIRSSFLVSVPPPAACRAISPAFASRLEGCRLSALALYPIKSCAAFQVAEWPVGPSGLLYDRSWVVVLSATRSALSLKQHPLLCSVRPSIDRSRGTMLVEATGHPSLEVSLDQLVNAHSNADDSSGKHSVMTRVCSDRVCGWHCGPEAASWFTRVLGKECFLLQQDTSGGGRQMTTRLSDGPTEVDEKPSSVAVSYANVAPFLCINEASVVNLHQLIQSSDADCIAGLDKQKLTERFRGNLVVSGFAAYEEDEWDQVQIGKVTLKCVGPCSRCRMICIDPDSGVANPEPLSTLAKHRGRQMTFGVYMYAMTPSSDHSGSEMLMLRVGNCVLPHK